MTNEKAYDVLVNKIQIDVKYTDDFNRDYECLMMCANALEKQIPKKPVEVIDNGTGTRCPKCNGTLLTNWKPNYCMFCGQAIDWGDSDDNN